MADMNPPSPNSVEQSVFNQEAAQAEQSMQGTGGQGEGSEYNQIAGMISDLDRRLRILEERYSNLRKKLALTDQNMLESERSFGKELKSVNTESLEMKRSVNEFSEKLVMLGGEMDNIAQKSDVMVIEKYLNMWSPTNFVTRNELKQFLKGRGIQIGPAEPQEDSEQ